MFIPCSQLGPVHFVWSHWHRFGAAQLPKFWQAGVHSAWSHVSPVQPSQHRYLVTNWVSSTSVLVTRGL